MGWCRVLACFACLVWVALIWREGGGGLEMGWDEGDKMIGERPSWNDSVQRRCRLCL